MEEANISQLKGMRAQPYPNLTIHVKVVSVGHTATFTAGDGSEKKILNISLADKTGAIKASINDETKFHHLAEGRSLSLRNFVVKSDKVALHSGTRIRREADIKVPDDIVHQATVLVHPPSLKKSLKEVSNCNNRDIVTVSGQLIKDEAKRTVMVGGSTPTTIRSITICEDGVSIEVTLWRDLADTPLEMGAYIQLTACQVNNYLNNKVLNSTRLTTIQITEAPVSEIKGVIQSYLIEGDYAELDVHGEDDTDIKDIKCGVDILAAAVNLTAADLDENLIEIIPMPVQIKMRGAEVISMLNMRE